MADTQFNWELLENTVHPADWEQFRRHLEAVLTHANQEVVANLALYYVRRYLPRFEEKYPHEKTWLAPHIAEIEQALAAQSNFDVIFPERHRSFKDPLARTYIWAVDYVWSMARWRTQQAVFVEYAANAIMNVITTLAYEARSNWLPPDFSPTINAEFSQYGVAFRIELIGKLKQLFRNR